MLAIDEMIGEATSHFLRRAALREVFQGIFLCCICHYGEQQGQNR